jgi:hypothetical protein
MRSVEARECIQQDPKHNAVGHPNSFSPCVSEQSRKAAAFDVLHDQKDAPPVFADLENRNGVGVCEQRCDLGFCNQIVRRMVDQVGMRDLDRDFPSEVPWTSEAREIHGAHPAGGDSLDDLKPSAEDQSLLRDVPHGASQLMQNSLSVGDLQAQIHLATVACAMRQG